MTKTATETCTEALRMIGVVADDEAATAEQIVRAKAHMTDIFAHLDDTEDLAVTWTIETVPDGVFLSFARAIAGSVATSYNRAQRAAEAAAMIDPRKSLYRIGIDGIKQYEARALNHENHTVTATYF